MSKYLTRISGQETLVDAIATSAGAGDAGKLIEANGSGAIDPTFVVGSSGSFQVGGSPRLKNSSDVLEVRNSADSAYARIRANEVAIGTNGNFFRQFSTILETRNAANTARVGFAAFSFTSTDIKGTLSNHGLLYKKAWGAAQAILPTTGFAQPGVRNSTSNTQEQTIDFDAASDESASFLEGAVPDNFSSTSTLTVTLICISTATSGNCIFTAAIRMMQPAQRSVDSSFAAASSSAATAVAGVAGTYFAVEITVANLDSLGLYIGSPYTLLITRDADNAGDTAAADVRVVAVIAEET